MQRLGQALRPRRLDEREYKAVVRAFRHGEYVIVSNAALPFPTTNNLSLLLRRVQPKATTALVNGVVVTERMAPWFAWAKHFAQTFASIGGSMIAIDDRSSVSTVASTLRKAAAMAGPQGFLILSVGHGGHGEANWSNEGFFDLGPHDSFRVAGANALLTGDSPRGGTGRPAQVSAYYDLRVPNPILAGGFASSRLDEDEASTNAAAKQRLANWHEYKSLWLSFAHLSGVVLLTCRVGQASEFLRRVAGQWGTAVIAYTRRVACDPGHDHPRIYLEGDAPGTGTNTPWGEYLIPISNDMVVFR